VSNVSCWLCDAQVWFRPKLYFVKVDVQACFDSIEQGKLLEIIRRVIKEVSLVQFSYPFRGLDPQDGYMIQRYARLLPNAGRIKKQFCRSAVPDGDSLPF
jgi:telomerase reverse transcriptase